MSYTIKNFASSNSAGGIDLQASKKSAQKICTIRNCIAMRTAAADNCPPEFPSADRPAWPARRRRSFVRRRAAGQSSRGTNSARSAPKSRADARPPSRASRRRPRDPVQDRLTFSVPFVRRTGSRSRPAPMRARCRVVPPPSPPSRSASTAAWSRCRRRQSPFARASRRTVAISPIGTATTTRTTTRTTLATTLTLALGLARRWGRAEARLAVVHAGHTRYVFPAAVAPERRLYAEECLSSLSFFFLSLPFARFPLLQTIARLTDGARSAESRDRTFIFLPRGDQRWRRREVNFREATWRPARPRRKFFSPYGRIHLAKIKADVPERNARHPRKITRSWARVPCGGRDIRNPASFCATLLFTSIKFISCAFSVFFPLFYTCRPAEESSVSRYHTCRATSQFLITSSPVVPTSCT